MVSPSSSSLPDLINYAPAHHPWPCATALTCTLTWIPQVLEDTSKDTPFWTRSDSTKTIDKPNSFAVSDAIALSIEIPPLVDTLVAAPQQRNLPTTGLLHKGLGEEFYWKGYSRVYQFKMYFYILACTTQLVMNAPRCTILCHSHHTQEKAYSDRGQYIVDVSARGKSVEGQQTLLHFNHPSIGKYSWSVEKCKVNWAGRV